MKKFLTILVLVLFVSGSASAAAVAQYGMEEGTGTTVGDSVGTNDGTISGGATWNGFGSGLTGGGSDSLNFDGSGEVLVADDAALTLGTGDFSVSFDIRGTAQGDAREVVYNKGNARRWELYTWDGTMYAEYDANDGNANDGKVTVSFAEGTILTGSWVHVDVVVDRSLATFGTLEVFKNGVSIGTSDAPSQSTFDSTFDLVIGGNPSFYDGALGGFTGDLDNFIVYNSAIPEPATLAVLALGAIAFLARRRR